MKIMKPALKVAILGFFSVFQVNGFVGPLQRTSLTCETPSIGRTPIEFVLKPQGFEFALSAETSGGEKSKLPFFLDPGTKGGAVFLSLVLFIIPIIIYNIVVSVFGVDEIEAGKWIGIGFTVLATLGWVSTYLFRAKQLKDYENAVIAKRLEELDEDELQALQEEVERDQF